MNVSVFKTRFLMKPFITLFMRLCNLPTFELVGMCSYAKRGIGVEEKLKVKDLI